MLLLVLLLCCCCIFGSSRNRRRLDDPNIKIVSHFYNTTHHHHHHYKRNASVLIFDHGECPGCIKEMHQVQIFSTSILDDLLEGNNKSYSETNATLIMLRSISNQTLEEIGEVMDKFVSPRPWWIVEVEPYAWMPWLRDVILLRVPQRIWKHFDAISRQNYRTAQDCAVTPLTVSGHSHDAWGNRLVLVKRNTAKLSITHLHSLFIPPRILNVEIEWGNLKHAVFLAYTTVNGKPTDTMGFVEASICPNMASYTFCRDL